MDDKLSMVLSGIKDGVIGLDVGRKIVIFNKKAEELTNLSQTRVLGKNIDEVIEFFEKDEKISADSYFMGLTKDNLKMKSSGEKQVFVNLVSEQMKEGGEFNLGCILTLHDLTKERELEEMKLDFVSMAAHELRTPLTSIKGYLSVFMEENKDKLTSEQNMFLNRINISSQQLMGLIENLLNVSKIERGAFSVNLEPMDWVSLVKDVLATFMDQAREKKLKLTLIEPTQPFPKVLADPLRIGEVLSNLLSNAITYTQKGRIRIWMESVGGDVITHVSDTGEGIPKEAIPHLFIKFFRVAGKLAQGSKGTGLGLYIAKAIIDMHHGKIWVESVENSGSTFSFSLPKAKG